MSAKIIDMVSSESKEGIVEQDQCFLRKSLNCRDGSIRTTTHPRLYVSPNNEKVLLYESCYTSNKSSAWIPLGGVVKQEPCSLSCQNGSIRATTHPRLYFFPGKEKVLFYESCYTSGKSSTWFSLGGVVEQDSCFL